MGGEIILRKRYLKTILERPLIGNGDSVIIINEEVRTKVRSIWGGTASNIVPCCVKNMAGDFFVGVKARRLNSQGFYTQ